MKAKPSRRGFLRGTGLVAMGFATGGTIICAADYAWALSTTAIDGHAAETLLVVARQLFPHDRLGDQYYAVMVIFWTSRLRAIPRFESSLSTALGGLIPRVALPGFNSKVRARRCVKSMEGSEFFATIRTATINNLYTNPLVYRFFGFEGSSVEHGGYIRRGFDDIGWLPSS